jgi:4-hydroxy-tetrahydrodipicolinate synthase
MHEVLKGIYTALVTPMSGGKIDYNALESLVIRQIEAGVQGLAVCASTGEGATLTDDERSSIIKKVIEIAGDRLQILVGTGCMSTWATIEATKKASDLGAKAALIAPPSYVKPSQDGHIAHYEAIAEESRLPIVVYNVPSRTSTDILPGTLARLAAHDRIVGIKEATGSILRVQQVIAAVAGKMSVLSGDDPITLSLLVAGGDGVICTASNAVPELWVSLFNKWQEGNIQAASKIQSDLTSLHVVLFQETNPGPVKAALHLLGLIEPEIRLPLIWPNQNTLSCLEQELTKRGYKCVAN